MKRGELYRVHKGSKQDPKDHRIFLVVSRQDFIESTFSSVVCAPVYSKYHDIETQVEVGVEEGVKHDSAIYCDALISIPKSMLTDFLSTLPNNKMKEVNNALRVALALE
jgi:mRNA interferase MazF